MKRAHAGSLTAAALLVALASCGPKDAARPAAAACQTEVFESTSFTDCVARRGEGEVRIYSVDREGTPLRSFAALEKHLGSDAKRVAFAMNAGMFDDKGEPIGLFISNGQVVQPLNRKEGPGNFHLLPNGVFSVETDGFHVRSTDRFTTAASAASLYATQSGPMLLIDGRLHPKIAPDGSSLNIRNAVGVDVEGNAHFVISDDPVSFGKLARYFRDVKHCRDALFFDGTVSSLWWPGGNRKDDVVPLGPLVVAIAAKP